MTASRWTLSLACGAALALAGASPAGANVYKPTRFDDPTPGKCKRTDCSLREAITKSNKHVGKDKIKLQVGSYLIELPENGSDNNKAGDFDVTDRVTIAGKGPETVVDGQEVSGVFSLLTFSAHTLKNMTIEDGNRSFGAGIATGPSKAVIKDVVLRSNTAGTEGGGGLYTVSTNLKVSRTTFVANSSPRGAGMYVPTGIVGSPSGTIESSTFDGNTGDLGAGLYLDGATHDISFTDDPDIEVVNSTFAGNQANVSGGGIAAILGAKITLDNSTVAYNGADVDSSGGGSGGGMYQSAPSDPADFQIKDIVLGENTVGSTGDGPQCYGEYTGGGLIAGSTSGCSIGGDFVADAKIGPLAENGGPTRTISLDADSPAVNRPNPFDCPALDQRGRKRDANCDSGSFERKPNDP